MGDIITGLWCNNPESGEVHVHFGSRWIDGESDVYINAEQDYGGRYPGLGEIVGASGDYNGDGADDIVASMGNTLVILAGRNDWEVGVPEESLPEMFSLSLYTEPNPFNSQVKLIYELSARSNIDISIYDTQGRLVERLYHGDSEAGRHERHWINGTVGLYFVVLQCGDRRSIRKVVCLP